MASDEFPYMDKNSERRMLFARCNQIKNVIGSRIFSDSENTGDFLFRDGQSSIEHINEGEWLPFGKNDHWGYREQYCWFRQTVTVPARFAGKKIAYETGSGDSAFQFIVYVNGKAVQGIDPNHRYIFLSDRAKAGETFDIALSAYCDDWNFCGQTTLSASLRVFDEDAAKLFYDLDSLLDAANNFHEDDVNRVDIVKEVNKAVNLLALDDPDEETYRASLRAACAHLHTHVFGAGAPVTISAIGHTHIDTAYLWRLRQTRDKAGRSFATVLNLMKEYPEYKFMSSQAQLYEYVKNDYPELYEEIKQAVKDGRWEPEGSMWVESDTNVVSGESLVRQFLFGKRFFKEEFGTENRIMWLPDVFGYSAALPQIMKKSGIDYFMTTKLSWNEYTRFPYDTFRWEGIDGSAVLAHFEPCTENDDRDDFNTTYNAGASPTFALRTWQRYSDKDLNRNVLCSFGHGDGGGGPTRLMLEQIRRLNEGIPGCPVMKQEFTRTFFDRLAKETEGDPRLPKWRGELYLQFHRGTLSSQARNKKYNRRCETALHDAETYSALARFLTGADYPKERINGVWKTVLLNQFHDIIPGSAIAPVYEDSKEQYEQALADLGELKNEALSALTAAIDTAEETITVFNSFGQARTEAAILRLPFDEEIAVADHDGTLLPSQKTWDGSFAFLAKDVPAKGYKTFAVKRGKQSPPSVIRADTKKAETPFIDLTFDKNMNIASLVLKESGETINGKETFGRLIAYEDRPHSREAWDLKCYYDERFWNVDNVVSAEVIEEGAVRTVVRIVRTFNLSAITQDYIFYAHTARTDIVFDIDWKEENIALKADFPVAVNTGRATFDIQFGNVERSTTNNTLDDYAQYEAAGQKWADLSDNGFGLSVLNDCKYGWNVKDGHIRPTLLRSATKPNHLQDRERHQFTFAFYPHGGTVDKAATVHEAYSLNLPLDAVHSEKHSGVYPSEFAFVSCDKVNVVIETLKAAEDTDSFILRLYETHNKTTACRVDFCRPLAAVSECDLMEENDSAIPHEFNSVPLSLRPFEIKTLRITLK